MEKRTQTSLSQTSQRSAAESGFQTSVSPQRPISFDVQPRYAAQPKPPKPETQPKPEAQLKSASSQPSASLISSVPRTSDTVSWQLAPVGELKEISLSLPQVSVSGFTTHRNAANPALAMNLLKEIQVLVAGWQVELQQTLKQIQDLYLEGAIVDGWLESYVQEETQAPTLRHAEVGCLLDYVEKTWGDSAPTIPGPPPVPDANPTGYRLCGLNEEGQLWFRHCPPEQISVVSLAIARYQKLKQLLTRKQTLETRLSGLAETLIEMHAELKQD